MHKCCIARQASRPSMPPNINQNTYYCMERIEKLVQWGGFDSFGRVSEKYPFSGTFPGRCSGPFAPHHTTTYIHCFGMKICQPTHQFSEVLYRAHSHSTSDWSTKYSTIDHSSTHLLLRKCSQHSAFLLNDRFFNSTVRTSTFAVLREAVPYPE